MEIDEPITTAFTPATDRLLRITLSFQKLPKLISLASTPTKSTTMPNHKIIAIFEEVYYSGRHGNRRPARGIFKVKVKLAKMLDKDQKRITPDVDSMASLKVPQSDTSGTASFKDIRGTVLDEEEQGFDVIFLIVREYDLQVRPGKKVELEKIEAIIDIRPNILTGIQRYLQSIVDNISDLEGLRAIIKAIPATFIDKTKFNSIVIARAHPPPPSKVAKTTSSNPICPNVTLGDSHSTLR